MPNLWQDHAGFLYRQTQTRHMDNLGPSFERKVFMEQPSAEQNKPWMPLYQHSTNDSGHNTAPGSVYHASLEPYRSVTAVWYGER